MDFMKTTPSDCEVRSMIKFSTVINKSGAEIYRRLCIIYSEEHLTNVQNVHRWEKMFNNGRTSIPPFVLTQACSGNPGQGGAVSVGPIWHACIAIRPAKHRMAEQACMIRTRIPATLQN